MINSRKYAVYGVALLISIAVLMVSYQIQTQPPDSVIGQSSIRHSSFVNRQSTYGRLPLSFEANLGQTDKRVKFLTRGAGYTFFLTPQEAVLSLSADAHSRDNKIKTQPPNPESPQSPAAQGKTTVLRLKLAGANPRPRLSGLKKLPGKSNYFIGNDPTKWRTGIPHYAKVEYQSIYPGINLVYYGNQRRLEWDFVVAPGADPKAIRFSVEGADKVEPNSHGDLRIRTAGSEILLQKPIIYQESERGRREISGGYTIDERSQVGFQLGDYDSTRPLVIDPLLVYSSYLGGAGSEYGRSVAVDGLGNAYITGGTQSANFPTTAGVFQTIKNGLEDVFVAKVNPSGSALVYSTYIGGQISTGFDLEKGLGVVVDSSGNAFIAGHTTSTDFPVTAGAFQPIFGSDPLFGGDAFVVKLNPAGSGLVYSTYLGGLNSDVAYDIAVDSSGDCYITGHTASANFPTTAGAFQTIKKGGYDAFVTKLNSSGSGLGYSTYLGGGTLASDYDAAFSIAVDAVGNAYLAGVATSVDFPTVNAIQSVHAGIHDAFATKLNPLGSPVYSTFLGGTHRDEARAVAIDSSSNLYVTGYTQSVDYPVANALQPVNNGDRDVILTKINGAGSAFVYSTYLGGTDWDEGWGVAVESSGNVYLTGFTRSSNFPTVDPIQGTNRGEFDAFLTGLNPAGNAFLHSSFLGGSGLDEGLGIVVDGSANVYVAGRTYSTNFPTTSLAFQSGGGEPNGDGFILMVEETKPPTFSITMSKATYVNGDIITASEFRPKNPNLVAIAVKLRIWLVVPGVGEVTIVETGGDGSFFLPGSLDQNIGPVSLLGITSDFPPRGNWEFNSLITNPPATLIHSQDINPFVVQ